MTDSASLAGGAFCLFVAIHWLLIPAGLRRRAVLGVTLVGLGLWQPVTTAVVTGYCWAIHRVGARARRGESLEVARRLGLLSVLLWVGVTQAPPALSRLALPAYAVPAGLSYLVFRAVHYLIECGRGTFEEDHDFGEFLLYMLFLPTFFGGPIERFERFTATGRTPFDRTGLAEGGRRILFGLFKKLVIADLLLHDALRAFSLGRLDLAGAGAGEVWTQLTLCYLYAYADFSALSDLAIGAARLLGYEICENFNWPILARDPGDFWQRWHMSLAGFCRYYIYLYVVGYTRKYFLGFLLTMVAMGLWHDLTARWALWGLHHAIGLYAFVRLRATLTRRGWWRGFDSKVWTVPRLVATNAYVILGYVWVGAPSVPAALRCLALAFGFHVDGLP